MQIARLQPLNLNAWGPVIDATTGALDDIKRGITPFFELSFLGTDFTPEPYVQASLKESGQLVLELMSNEYLKPKINKFNESQLRILGFQVPDNSNPNFHRECSPKEQPILQAKILIEAARRVFDLQDNTWFAFGGSNYEKALAESDAFWHYKGNKQILCLPGRNESETLEGSTGVGSRR